MKSIKTLKKNLPEDAEVFSVTRKEHSLPLSMRKLFDLTHVIRQFVAAENFFLKNFSGIQGLEHISYPRRLRDHYVKEGLPEALLKLGLQDRQWKMALDVAFANIKSSHTKTQNEVKVSLNRSKSLQDGEKHLVRYALMRPHLLYLICLRRFKEAEALLGLESESSKFNPTLKEAIHGNDGKTALHSKKVFTWLSRRYRELHSKHQQPVIRKPRTYHVDSSMFKFFREQNRCYIAVASLVPMNRIVIPLSNKALEAEDFSGNIKIVLKKDNQIEVHRAINRIVKKPQISREKVVENENNFRIISIDKGLKCLIHTDSDHKYGEGYLEKFQGWSDQLSETNAGRAYFHSLIRKLQQDLQNTKNPSTQSNLQRKINRILENNLGDIKMTAKRDRIKHEIKKEIGTAVNSLFKVEQPEVLITENLKFISFRNLGKRTNRLLNSWSKGVLRDALEQGAKKNGVLLEEINAAFTSQQCLNCFYVSRRNRHGDRFACVVCQHKEDADFAAAKNVRSRFFDSEIGIQTPLKEVKEILLKRHRMRLSILGLNKSESRFSSANYQGVM